MSDAAEPGPSSTEPDHRQQSAPETDAVPTGEPDATPVEEASADATGARPTDEPDRDDGQALDPLAPDGPTSEPGAELATEAEIEDDSTPDDVTPSTDEADADTTADERGTDEQPGAGVDLEPEQPSAGVDLEPEQPGAGVDLEPVRVEVAGVRAGVEAMLPDLAATAREETVTSGLAGLQRGLDEMVRLTRRADEHVAELHAENQRLRGGELAAALQPMLRDVVRLHDEVTRLAEASHPEAHADLDLVRSRLLDTLARWGLTPFSPGVGEPLDGTRHQGVGRVPSSDGEPGTIASVRRPGFTHDDGRTFRPAEVEVFAPPPAPPAPQTEE